MRKTLIIAVISLMSVIAVNAQSGNTTEWKGFYLGGSAFFSHDNIKADGSVAINQVSGLFVPSRGIVIVPGTSRTFSVSDSKTNGGGGFDAGYLWQHHRMVFGVEGDFDPFHRTAKGSMSQDIPPTALTPISQITTERDIRYSNEFSIRGRVGFTIGHRSLIYFTGGYAAAKVRATAINTGFDPGGQAAPNACNPVTTMGCTCLPGTSPDPTSGNCPSDFGRANFGAAGPVVRTSTAPSQWAAGWTLGVGFDHKIGKRFSVGAEYRHTDLGARDFLYDTLVSTTTGAIITDTHGGTAPGIFVVPNSGSSGGSLTTPPDHISLKSDMVRFRFNVHF